MVNQGTWKEDERVKIEATKKEASDRLQIPIDLVILGKANAADLSNIVLTLSFFILFLFFEPFYPEFSRYFPLNYLAAITLFYMVSHWLVNHTMIERYLNNFESAHMDCIRRSYSEMYQYEKVKGESYKGVLLVYYEEEHVIYAMGTRALLNSKSNLEQNFLNLNNRFLDYRNKLDRIEFIELAIKEIDLNK